MGNALVRAQVHRVRVEANGDPDDLNLRRKIDKLGGAAAKRERELREAEASGDAKKIKRAKNRLAKAKAELKAAIRKDNVVTVSLAYPRSGQSSVTAIRPMDLPAGGLVDWSGKDFFDAAILKETIQGETELEVKVADKDKINPFWLFIRGVLSSVFSKLAGDAIGGISEVFVSKAADGISGKIAKVIKGDDKAKVSIVGASKKARILIAADGKISVPNAGSGADAPITYDQQSGILGLKLTAPSRFVKKVTITKRGGQPKRIEEYMEKGEPNGFVELALSPEKI